MAAHLLSQMLPAVYRWVGANWGATPTQLGYITLARALVQALAAPVGGVAGGREQLRWVGGATG